MEDSPIFTLGVAVIMFVMGVGGGFAWRESQHRDEMVRRGYAEYVMDPKTGVSTWRMKP